MQIARIEAQSANKAKSAFLANMSHKIRTPINVMLGMNEMILRESESEEICQYAKSIERSGGYLISLINNILDISRIESYFRGKDTGIGIKEENFPVLFDAFMRVDSKKNKKIKGTGFFQIFVFLLFLSHT